MSYDTQTSVTRPTIKPYYKCTNLNKCVLQTYKFTIYTVTNNINNNVFEITIFKISKFNICNRRIFSRWQNQVLCYTTPVINIEKCLQVPRFTIRISREEEDIVSENVECNH